MGLSPAPLKTSLLTKQANWTWIWTTNAGLFMNFVVKCCFCYSSILNSNIWNDSYPQFWWHVTGDVINQGRKIYNGRHACLTKENNSFITKCDGIITHCDSLVYYEVRWTVITNCDSFFITKCARFIANCDRYYKVRWLLQTATVHGRVFFNVIAIFPNNSTTR